MKKKKKKILYDIIFFAKEDREGYCVCWNIINFIFIWRERERRSEREDWDC
jgi:hypothetical protein